VVRSAQGSQLTLQVGNGNLKTGLVRVELAADLRDGRFALLIDREEWHRAQGSWQSSRLRAHGSKFPRSTKWNYQLLTHNPRPSPQIAASSSQPVPLAADCSKPSGLSEPRIQSDTDSQQELGQEIVADPALHSGQCGSSALGNCVPWTWAKNGNLVAPSLDRIWADLFDTVDSWEKYSQNCASQTDLRPLLRIYYVQKEWTLVFSNSQRHFQFLGFPTSPNMGHAPHNQALLPKPTKWPLRPCGTLEPHDYTLWPNMLDPSTPYRPYIYHLKSDPPPYVSAMCSMNDGIKTPLPYYKELYRRFFADSFTIARDWEIIAEAWKVPGIPPLPTKPHGLEKQYSVQLIEDFIWENPELSLNLL
ncbi:hypothetical protein BS47DRAFT_1370164, partial [Hydnum rufescens UP504]